MIEFYKVTHIVGILTLMVGLTAMLVTKYQNAPDTPLKKFAGILHGLGLVLALVGGLGLVVKTGVGFQGWVVAKLGIWLALGAGTLTAKFLPLPGAISVLLTLAGIATAIAVTKPF